MCRLCLSENECLINIFEMNVLQGFVAAEVISDLLQLKVTETDVYPHVVCSTCITKLTDFKLFKEFCLKSKVTYDSTFILSESLVMQPPDMDEESESQVSPHTSATVNPAPSNDEVISSDLIASGITVNVEPLEDEVIESRASEYSSATVNPTSSDDEVILSGMIVEFDPLEDAGGLELCDEDPLKGNLSDESDDDGSHLELFEQNQFGEASSDHPHPLLLPPPMPAVLNASLMLPPPKFELRCEGIVDGVTLFWNADITPFHEEIMKYEIHGYQKPNCPLSTTLWKKIGEVKPLPLPIGSTLTRFPHGYWYYFAIRGVDIRSRFGPLSYTSIFYE